MARYIDEKDVYKLVEPMGTARVHCSQIDDLPRADVVPKNEVENLKELLEMNEKAYESLRELYHTDTDALVEARKKTETEVAREILRYLRLNEDIAIRCKEENGDKNEEYWKGKLAAFKQIRGFIDVEIKKKYTEK